MPLAPFDYAPFAIEPLPDWWPDEPVFHGTKSNTTWRSIQANGLCCPPAYRASGDDYGWKEVWRHEVSASYKSLSPAQRKRLHAHLGLPNKAMSQAALGDNLALFWVSRNRKASESYKVLTEVDLSKLNYYWWFPDDVLGDNSYVFVLPVDCPQAPRSVLRRMSFDTEPLGKWGYVNLRGWQEGRPVETWARDFEEAPDDDETVFFSTLQAAYSNNGSPIGRFPAPSNARLLDSRESAWATPKTLIPGNTWQVFDDRLMQDDDSDTVVWRSMRAWAPRPPPKW